MFEHRRDKGKKKCKICIQVKEDNHSILIKNEPQGSLKDYIV